MTIDKRISYEVQGGAKNYLGKQKEVTAPIKWKSSPDSPETELAYITKAEKDLLVKKDIHGSLKGDVNRGPSGIMSLDGYGSFDGPDPSKDTGMSGVATSAAEAGGGSGADRKELESYISRDQMTSTQLPPGVTKQLPQNIREYRDAFIAAGGGQRVNPGFFDSRNTVSRAELARAKAFNPAAFKATRGGGLMNFFTSGGLLGNIIRGLGQKFGLGKRFDQPTYDMRGLNTRVYEAIPGVSTNPSNLDIYNEFVTEDDEEDKELFNVNEIKNLIEKSKNKTASTNDGIMKVAELSQKQLDYLNSQKGKLDLELLSPKDIFENRLPLYENKPFFGPNQEPTTTEEFNEYLKSIGMTQTV